MAELATLCHCADPVLAEQLCAELTAEGLHARIMGADRDPVLGGAGAFVGLHIVVPRDELDEAEAMLEELEGPWSEGEEAQAAARASLPSRFVDEDEGDDEGESEDDDEMPERLSPLMRYVAWRYSWPVLLAGGIIAMIRGRYTTAVFALLFAALAFGVTRPDGDNDDEASDPEP